MIEYFEKLDPLTKEYFYILSKEIPQFIYDYVDTDAMKRIDGVGCGCGTDYTKLYTKNFFYSNLRHSIGVALIIWNFTKDKKQTLAGLFHDISTPVFKHCVDFMNGDYEKQESTEELTTKMITESEEIMKLLKRDNILVEEVADYHKYPIADNDTPKLSADRLEYTLTHSICSRNIWSLEQIERFYKDITILKNEDNIEELGFKTLEIAEEFVDGAKKMWMNWVSNQDKLTLKFYATIMKKMSDKGLVTLKDLYTLSEKEMIEKIENCEVDNIANSFKNFRNATRIYESDEPAKDKFCISVKTKRRYIIPLVSDGVRIDKASQKAREIIEDYLSYETPKYAYLDFNV